MKTSSYSRTGKFLLSTGLPLNCVGTRQERKAAAIPAVQTTALSLAQSMSFAQGYHENRKSGPITHCEYFIIYYYRGTSTQNASEYENINSKPAFGLEFPFRLRTVPSQPLHLPPSSTVPTSRGPSRYRLVAPEQILLFAGSFPA
jgi:hypothetical protein